MRLDPKNYLPLTYFYIFRLESCQSNFVIQS